MATELDRIDEQLRASFESGAWHGPSVLEALDGIGAEAACAHPIEGSHSVWELVLHLGGTYDLVLRRLRGDARQLTPEEDWPMPASTSAEAWKDAVRVLHGLNHELRQAIRNFPVERLDAPLIAEPPYTAYTQFIGITQHNLYHAGQMALLRRALGLFPGSLVRPERPGDAAAIRRVTEAAFGQPAEGALVDALRGTAAFIPALSLVAEQGAQIVGHILFSRVQVVDGDVQNPALALAPMAVLPGRQNQGIGSALVRRGLDEARALGFRAVIVQGHPAFYPRFGFEAARASGLTSPFDSGNDAFMVLALQPGALDQLKGEVRYPREFFET
jgi:putative acetyltransferase